jgi:hypothetical protein
MQLNLLLNDMRIVQIFRNITGFMGDRRSSKSDIDHALKLIKNAETFTPELTDELFCQLCKQLRNNPSMPSRHKGWKLFLVCLTCVCPSPRLLPHVLAFCRDGAKDLHGTPHHAGTASDDLLACCRMAVMAMHVCGKATTSQMAAETLRGETKRRKHTPTVTELQSIMNVRFSCILQITVLVL